MSPLDFYRVQAAQQRGAVDAAMLQNVRERHQRAADAWVVLASRSAREAARQTTLADPADASISGSEEHRSSKGVRP